MGTLALVVVAVAAGATFLLTGSSGTAAVLAWTPADAVMYGEARLDLPGDQAAELAELMQAFPGFDDQAAFPVKLAEALDEVVGKASDGKYDWQTDIEPWFGGQVGGSVSALPKVTDAAAARAPSLVSVKDAALATAWAQEFVTEQGGTTSTEDYAGSTITVVTPPADLGAKLEGLRGGYVIAGPGPRARRRGVAQGRHRHQGTGGLPTNAQFKEAERGGHRRPPRVRVLRLQAFASSLTSMLPEGAAAISDGALAAAPRVVRADRPRGELRPGARRHAPAPGAERDGPASKLPGLVPSGTLSSRRATTSGGAAASVRDQLAAEEASKDAVKQLDDAFGILGGFESVTGWAGETGVALSKSGDTLTGGVVSVPTDKAAADRLFNSLKAFVQLGGAQAGLTITEEVYNGTTITVVNLAGIGALAGEMAEGLPLPTDLKISYAVTDDVVVLGYGTDFTKAVLDAAAGGASLAKDARFADALRASGRPGPALVWVDIAGLRGTIEALVPAEEKAAYESDVKPYLDALDYLIETMEPGEQYDKLRAVIHFAGD